MAGVLVLRPEPAASLTVAKAKGLGLQARAAPLFEIERVEWALPEPGSFDGLLLTSANALRCGGEKLQKLRGLKVFAVGDATAEAARGAGFDIAASGSAGVDRLLGSIDSELKLLHLCGHDRHEPKEARQSITPIAVYRAVPIPKPDLAAETAAVALIHSQRAGRRFAELVDDRRPISIAAISDAAAQAAGGGWKTVAVADAATDDALLALAASLCNKPDPQ